MPEFTYEALDKSGQTARGEVTARDSADAAVKVRSLGYFPTRIGADGGKSVTAGAAATAQAKEDTKSAAAGGIKTSSGKKISRIQVMMFTREMADLLDAGLPMDRAFSVLIDQTEIDSVREMLQVMQGDIRAGQPLSEALTRYPREFSTLYTNMARAGEVSGQLPSVMARLADFMEKEQVRKSQIMAALTYPLVLICVATLAITFLLTFVIPKLSGVFKDLGSELPLPTVLLLSLSGIIAHYWWALIIGLVAVIYGFRAWLRTPAGGRSFDGFQLNLPYFGVLAQKVVAARLVRTLGTLLGGGVPILESLDIAASALGNVVSSESLIAARGLVRQGETLNEAMEKSGTFLPVVLHMTAVGEETGRLPNMLLRTADTLDFEVDNTMRRLTSLVEPLVVLFMGCFIGFVVLSILLPIFKANTLAH